MGIRRGCRQWDARVDRTDALVNSLRHHAVRYHKLAPGAAVSTHGCLRQAAWGWREMPLNQNAFLKLAAFVDPAAVLGPDDVAVPQASVGLEHDRGRGFPDD